MTQQTIEVGDSANDRKGDSLRAAFQKVNSNFTELYTALGLDTDPLNLGAFTFADSVISTEDSSNIVIDRPTTINGELSVDGDITPKTDLGASLGTADKRFQDLYLSGNTIFLGTTRLSVDEQGQLLVEGSVVGDVGTADWANVTGKPEFAAVATSGDYADLDGAPTLAPVATSGDYGDLNNKPTIPTVPTDLSQLNNDANFIVLQDAIDYGFLTAADIADGITVNSTGDLKGSVFADDSTMLVDATNAKIVGDIEKNGILTLRTTDNDMRFYAADDFYFEAGEGANDFVVNAGLIELRGDVELDGTLTFPDATVQTTAWTGTVDTARNIESESDISIRVNLTDSTTHTWRFGEDGDLNLPGAIRTAASNIAIGNGAGETNQSVSATAIGFQAGQTNQGIGAIALGDFAGNSGQVLGAISIGSLTGALDQGFRAIAIGSIAGNTRQGQYGIGIGYGAGGFDQGDYAIALGFQAASSGQATKSIALNANDVGLDAPESGFYVNPVRNVDGGAFLNYNVSTKEIGYSNDIRSENAINIDINLSDSTLRRWTFGEDGDLTFPNGQQIDTTDADLLLIGTSNAGLKLNSVSQSALLTAKKSFARTFEDTFEGATFTAVPGDPPKIIVVLANNEGAYLKELLRRLETKLFFENDDFPYAYNNITIALRPSDENITANVILVEQSNSDPLEYEITIDQDPTSVVGNLDYIQIRYDYENTIGVDVDRDIFGIATDNDDIDIISGRDIDLRAGDDISILANSIFEMTLARNDFQDDTDGIVINTDDPNAASYGWRFQFDGNLSVPGAIVSQSNDLELSSATDVNINTSVGDEDHVFEFKGDGTFYMAKNTSNNVSYISTPRNDSNANLNLVSALDLTITTNESDVTKEWAFGRDGNLDAPGDITFPNGGYIQDTEAFFVATPGIFQIQTDKDGTQKDWTFAADGVLTLPGAVISSPVSPTGGTDLVGEAATIIVTNGPNLNWNSTGAFANGINFTFIVDGSGNATVVVNDGGTGHTVGETFSMSGSLVGGTSPADDVNFEITSIVESRTALSLTKQVQILEDGFYTLADGDEGQIMYFVPASGTTTGTYVVIDNARIIDVGNTDLPVDDTDYSWTPFFGETEAPRTIAMAIFADGAWCLRGGVTD